MSAEKSCKKNEEIVIADNDTTLPATKSRAVSSDGKSCKKNEEIVIVDNDATLIATKSRAVSSDRKSCKKNEEIVIADNDATLFDTKSRAVSSDVIVIDDQGDVDFSELWLRIGGIPLYSTDKQIISDGNWLWGTHLSALQFLLKQQFPVVKGLEDCNFVLREGNVLQPGSVQILHVNGNH